jgi:hypothetical protein
VSDVQFSDGLQGMKQAKSNNNPFFQLSPEESEEDFFNDTCDRIMDILVGDLGYSHSDAEDMVYGMFDPKKESSGS